MVTVFALYPSKCEKGNDLLSFVTFEDDTTQNAEEHKTYMD